jgi:imidazole glycerol-phosphate synthase subunit HisH
MVGVIDYGMGNLLSVVNALELLGADVAVCTRPEQLNPCDRVVLPGVGAFGDCMSNLKQSGIIETLEQVVRKDGRPFLGICLGMQALAKRSGEGSPCDGLGWIDAEVVLLTPGESKLRIPHMGWNDIAPSPEAPLFRGLPDSPEFYFVHSYHVRCADRSVVSAECDYGGTFTAAVTQDNICATQFHPEKSQFCGLQVLANFLSWKP